MLVFTVGENQQQHIGNDSTVKIKNATVHSLGMQIGAAVLRSRSRRR